MSYAFEIRNAIDIVKRLNRRFEKQSPDWRTEEFQRDYDLLVELSEGVGALGSSVLAKLEARREEAARAAAEAKAVEDAARLARDEARVSAAEATLEAERRRQGKKNKDSSAEPK